jgi:NAD(P)H-dependent FMN reductase/ketosteroid isomerase-like protein
MTVHRNIAVLVGSLREASLSRKAAQALIERAPASMTARIVEIGDLPLYNEDLEDAVPEAWTRFRAEIAKSDAVLWVTPEYNRSIPGCLKNALDVGTRPSGKNVFNGMPSAVVSVTPYKLGGLAGNLALRAAFVFPNLPVMQQPEAYLANAKELFADGLNDDATSKFLTTFMAAFAAWIETIRSSPRGAGFDEFMKQRERAATAYVIGDAKPVDALATANDPATFFHPNGDVVQGAKPVVERMDRDAKAFDAGGSSHFDVLQQNASGDLAFWCGYQLAEARMHGKPDPIPMKLRVTEVFRHEGGAWKLVHRHAEAAKPR